MNLMKDQATPVSERRATEYLANERTFLAWIRTSIAIISLGFVVAKFSVWLNELAAKLQPGVTAHHTGASMPIGISMMALGGLLAVLAAWRYHVVNLSIEKGVVGPDRGLVIVVTAMVTMMCGAMIVYMLLTGQHA
jgi:putative membrane protein